MVARQGARINLIFTLFRGYQSSNSIKDRESLKRAADDVQKFLTRIAPYVRADAARNLNRVSRDLHIPYQTLHFRMNRLGGQGISIIPVINPDALGLERYRVSLDIPAGLTEFNAESFFGALHQSTGLSHYARCLSSYSFDCEFLIPKGKAGEFSKLLKALEEMSLIERTVARRLLWRESLMMKTQFYDYSNGEWDVDYSRLSGDPSAYGSSGKSEDARECDEVDLFIIKSLEKDPSVKLEAISKEIKLSGEDVGYHLKKHVFGRKQVPEFRFMWVGTKDGWAKHKIILMTYVFRSLSDESARHAMSVLTALPFTWNHMRGEDGSYIVELVIPVSQLAETMHYLSYNLRPLNLRPDEVLFPDWSCSYNYTVPYQLFSNERGWQLNSERSLEQVLQVITPKSK
jgi:hypothetical protein